MNSSGRIAKWAHMPLFLSLIFLPHLECTNPVKTNEFFVPWDTSFVVDGLDFPNDTIYNRAEVSSGSNWRFKQFVGKCKSRDTVRVGFIGGSITAGAVTSTPSMRFSTRFCTAIQSCFPNIKHVIELNAGIGSTNSRFGCSRVYADLLSKHPDLVVIDFAVNDFGMGAQSGAGDSQYICSCTEGLVRQCLLQDSQVPALLMFFSKGDGTNVQQMEVVVGNHYSLPMISYRDAIWPLVESNRIPWSTFFYNDPHPNDTGHLVAAYLLYSYLKSELTSAIDQKMAVPTALFTDIYQYAGVYAEGDTSILVTESSWLPVLEEDSRVGFSSARPLDSMAIYAQCHEVTIGIHMQSTASSAIKIDVDNGALDTVLYNNYQFEYTSFTQLFISPKILAHTIKISHIDSIPFKIDYLLYAKPL